MLMRVCLTVDLRYIILLWCIMISLAGLYLLFDLEENQPESG